MNRQAFTKCTMVNERIRIARAINYCLNAVRSIVRTSRAQSSAVSKWAETCVNTAHDVHSVVTSRSVAAADRIASTAHDVQSVASRSAAAVVGIASTSRVTVRRKSAASATCVLRKGTLYTYAASDDTMRS